MVLAIQHLGRWAGPTVLVYIEDALAELPGCRRPSEDLPPILERLERIEDHITTLVKALNSKDRELAAAYKINLGKFEDRLSSLTSSLESKNLELVATTEASRAAAELAASATHTHVISEPESSRGSNLIEGKVHILASRQPDAPAWSWRTTCGWYFTRRSSAWRLATSAEANLSDRPRCDRCKPLCL